MCLMESWSKISLVLTPVLIVLSWSASLYCLQSIAICVILWYNRWQGSHTNWMGWPTFSLTTFHIVWRQILSRSQPLLPVPFQHWSMSRHHWYCNIESNPYPKHTIMAGGQFMISSFREHYFWLNLFSWQILCLSLALILCCIFIC